jgi:hypothetical protein
LGASASAGNGLWGGQFGGGLSQGGKYFSFGGGTGIGLGGMVGFGYTLNVNYYE